MKTLLLLANGFELAEAAAFTDIFGWNTRFGKTPMTVSTCSHGREVRCAFNTVMKTDLLINEVDPDNYEALAIPGGFGESGYYSDAYNEKFLKLIVEFNSRGKYIAAVCTGAMPLAKAGILNNKKATTYHIENNRQFTLLSESGAQAVREDIVRDGNIITSCGPSTAPGVALMLLSMLTSESKADNIAKLMGYKP